MREYTEAEIYEIADRMMSQSPELKLNRTYMFCIARQALKGIEDGDVHKGARESIGRYFTAWSDGMNDELADAFVKAYNP